LQEFGFDFMTPIACKKSVNLMSPLWCDRRRDLRVCNKVVSIITDAKLVRERDLCHYCADQGWPSCGRSPRRSAPPEVFDVEEIVDPRETRPYLCRFIDAAQSSLRTKLGPKPKYGVRPSAALS
jgi:hypothetical protein